MMNRYKVTYYAREKGAEGISYLHTMEVELSESCAAGGSPTLEDFAEIRNAVDKQGQEFCIPQKEGWFNVPEGWNRPWLAEKIEGE
jgi:hypothetical protein|tara:strand:- start:198 stop:455 length:258 start_codon:yes stop_codon:yes gene_type:complete